MKKEKSMPSEGHNGTAPIDGEPESTNDFNEYDPGANNTLDELFPLMALANEHQNQIDRTKIIKKICITLCQMAEAGIEGGIDANSFFTAVNGIAAGIPQTYPTTMQNFARYGFDPLAVMGAIEIVLEQQASTKLLPARKIWKAASENIRTTSFLIPFFFFTLSNIVNALKRQSLNSTVDIPDWAAAAVITTCFLIGSLASVKNYFDKEREADPAFDVEDLQKTQRFFYYLSHNVLVRRVLAFLDGASTLHWLIYAVEQFMGVTSSPVEKIARFAATGAGGLLTAILRGGQNPQEHWYARPLNILMLLTKAVALAFSTYATFQPHSGKSFWEKEALQQQFYFWVVAYPLFLISCQLLSFIQRCCQEKPESVLIHPQAGNDNLLPTVRPTQELERQPSDPLNHFSPGYDSARDYNDPRGIAEFHKANEDDKKRTRGRKFLCC